MKNMSNYVPWKPTDSLQVPQQHHQLSPVLNMCVPVAILKVTLLQHLVHPKLTNWSAKRVISIKQNRLVRMKAQFWQCQGLWMISVTSRHLTVSTSCSTQCRMIWYLFSSSTSSDTKSDNHFKFCIRVRDFQPPLLFCSENVQPMGRHDQQWNEWKCNFSSRCRDLSEISGWGLLHTYSWSNLQVWWYNKLSLQDKTRQQR